jgi:DNA-directed RNA polymerase specialized sigma24 family protein
MRLYSQASNRQSASLEAIDIWESLLQSCGDPIDTSVLQLARAGYNKSEIAKIADVAVATVYRRLQGILARYKAI